MESNSCSMVILMVRVFGSLGCVAVFFFVPRVCSWFVGKARKCCTVEVQFVCEFLVRCGSFFAFGFPVQRRYETKGIVGKLNCG